MTIMRCFSPCLAVPTGPNGIGDPAGMGTGEKFAPLRLTGTGWGMRNGEWGWDGEHPPSPAPPRLALPRPVDRLTAHSSL